MPIIPDSITSDQVPSPVAGAALTPPPPNLQNLPVDTRQPQPSPVQPTPPADRHAVIGRFLDHLRHSLEGTTTAYDSDPATGTVVEKQVPRKAGGFFRDLVASSLAGMAAASMADNAHPSGAAGLGIGFSAAQNAAQIQANRARDVAQRNAAALQQRKQASDEQNLLGQMNAVKTMHVLNFGHHIGLMTDDQIQNQNAAESTLRQIALEHGGNLADVQGNDQAANGPSLMAKFSADPTLMQAADGYHRLPIITFDTTGLQHDRANHRWAHDDGSPLTEDEWNQRGKVTLVDVPASFYNAPLTLNGRTIKALNPNSTLIQPGKEDRNYTLTAGSALALNTRQVADVNKEMQQLRTPPANADQLKQDTERLQDIRARMQSDPDSVSDAERRFAGVRGQMLDRINTQQAAAPVVVNDFKDAQNMLSSDNPKEANAARDFFVSSMAGPSGEKVAAFIQANPTKFSPDQVKTAKTWAKSYGNIKASEKPEKPDGSALWAGKADIFGSPLGGPEVDRKEFNKRYDAFSKDYIQPLNRLKKTDTELTRIMSSSQMTGAQKVTALLAAVGISGDPLQGKGFRINQAIVGEHAGARNIWESAAQRANNLIGSGGPITEKQVRDYESIARDVVHDAFVAAGNEAHRQGLPVDFLPRGGGQAVDPDTAKLYLDIAGGDKDAARKAAKANGWRF